MRAILAAGAALMLAACGQQGSGVALPPVQQGAQAPSTQTAPSGPVQQAQISPEQREQFLGRVRQYLDMATNQLGGGATAAQGFTDQTAAMQPGTDHRWQVELVGGTAYRFVGACDDDCTNLDIELIDAQTGGVVASDMLQDDFPIVDFTPQANGRYIVRMLMQTCSVAPCFAGARVLTAQAGASSGGK
jgi:hypothetical protein